MADKIDVIGDAKPHTVKKFELITEYVKAWAYKLLNCKKCKGIVFIDCMSNSGIYSDINGNEVFGTPIRVSKALSDIMKNYYGKDAWLYFNDFSSDKIELLKTHLPEDTQNFHIHTSIGDGNELLKQIGHKLSPDSNVSFLLLYDPFEATIDWEAIFPFLKNWGEVIINHMLSDSIRAVSQAKSHKAIEKYEKTYLTDIENLIPFGSDKKAFEKRVEEIVMLLKGRTSRKYYIAAFPFFNRRNAIEYNLIHCTSNIEGFKLYKKIAWKTFGDKSSIKNTHGLEMQFSFDMDEIGRISTTTDEFCYYLKDIVDYIQDKFRGRQNVSLTEVWNMLDEHPVFPSEGYKPQIKKELIEHYGAHVSMNTISFTDRR